MIVGLVSDTHGLLRPVVLDALAGVDRILHAGDVGGAHVLEGLARVAPVLAVRGNNDPPGAWPDTRRITLEGRSILVLHVAEDAVLDGADIVVSGHSHRPSVAERDGVLWVNPGSAGPRRFRLPIAVAILTVEGARADARIVTLG